MLPVTAAVQRVLYEVDREWGRRYRSARELLGWTKPKRVVPYRGWAFLDRATILARVLEDRGAPPWREGAPLRETFAASYKRYATVEVPEAEIEVQWDGSRWRERTDEEGHLELVVTPPSDAKGWSPIEFVLRDGALATSGEILVSSPHVEHVVVSDIDDTVIDTNVRHPLERAAALFLTDSRVRLPFAGVAAFYRALERGRNPIFYLSSSPWNLYEHLCELFVRHEIPKGPMLLRDWGISRDGIAPLSGHAHKQKRINQLIADHPHVPFVLIGDSSQEDALHYVSIAEHHPGRVAVIYIRDVGGRHRHRLDELAERARRLGIELVLVDHTDAAARHAASIGLIRTDEVVDVVEDRRADEAMATPLAQALSLEPT